MTTSVYDPTTYTMFVRDISEIKDGITSILVLTKDSDLHQEVTKKMQKNDVDDSLYLVDIEDQESKLISSLQSIEQIKKDLKTDCLIFLNKKAGSLEYISHRPKPESKYDWLDVAKAFKEHYGMSEADDSGYWRWGQIVPEDGEYLCLDCGYIEDLSAGEIFPVCEVCLAGDPEGPLSVRDGFWEKI